LRYYSPVLAVVHAQVELFLHKENQFGRVDWNLPECAEESSKARARSWIKNRASRRHAGRLRPDSGRETTCIVGARLRSDAASVVDAVRRVWAAEIKDTRGRPVYAPPKGRPRQCVDAHRPARDPSVPLAKLNIFQRLTKSTARLRVFRCHPTVMERSYKDDMRHVGMRRPRNRSAPRRVGQIVPGV
jgi:hypothetical protein